MTTTAVWPPSVSLIIPVKNEEAYVERCLASVLGQDYPQEALQVIVVDGGSSDQTGAAIGRVARARERWLRLDNPEGGLIAGLNLGIEAATGEFIGYVNGHSELPPEYVTRMIEILHAHGAWSAGGAVDRVANSPTQAAFAVAMSHPMGVGDSKHNFAKTAGPAETVFPGFWPRWVFDRVGRFDPHMVANEDNELSYRIRAAGGIVWYDPSVVIRYHPRTTFAASFRQLMGYGEGKVTVFRKHPGALQPRHLVPAAWIAFVCAGAVGAAIRPWMALLYAVGVCGYATATGMTALLLGRARGVSPPRLWAAFAAVHAGYGVGTWRGLLHWAVSRLRDPAR